MFTLFKRDPKSVDSLKVEFDLIPDKKRDLQVINLYQAILRQVKGNQNHKEYKAFEGFCYALQIPLVTLDIS